MNILRVPYELRDGLKRLPEYSMGVQRVLIKLPGGAYRNGWILNGRLFLSDDDKSAAEKDSNKLLLLRLALLATTADEASRKPVDKQSHLTIVTIVPRSAESLKGVRRVTTLSESKLHTFTNDQATLQSKAAGAAKDAPITPTQANEIFKRFSAYKDDFRVTPGRGLTPGTFATTAADAALVHTGAEAVARYALPNKAPANQVFTIRPPEKTNLQRGIAQPAYGEPGGGVEVIFVDGSPDATVYGPDEIPAT
jgi:hypothetical protein